MIRHYCIHTDRRNYRVVQKEIQPIRSKFKGYYCYVNDHLSDLYYISGSKINNTEVEEND